MKRDHAFPQSHVTYCSRRLLISFQAKTFPLNPMLQIDAIINFDLFLNLAFYYIKFTPNPDLPTSK